VSVSPELSTVTPTWTADDVAAHLRIRHRSVVKMAVRGEIPALRLGKLYRFDPQKIVALFDGGAARES
jgi:excisionase family DNA binding protein